METKSLDELLGDEPAEIVDAPVVETEPVETAEAAAQRERDERGRFAAKGETDAPPASSEGLPPEEFKGLKDERRKRQEAEQAIADLRAEIEALKSPPAPPAPAPDIWENTEGWQQHFGGQVINTAVQQATLNANLNMSEMMARDKFEDFDEIKAEFIALAQENPQLGQQALNDPHPWRKAYQIAKNHRTMNELGATDLETMRAKMREELLAEMAAQAVPGATATIPASLSNERNVGQRSGPQWTGPKSLDDILR